MMFLVKTSNRNEVEMRNGLVEYLLYMIYTDFYHIKGSFIKCRLKIPTGYLMTDYISVMF